VQKQASAMSFSQLNKKKNTISQIRFEFFDFKVPLFQELVAPSRKGLRINTRVKPSASYLLLYFHPDFVLRHLLSATVTVNKRFT
jgi:hypothetical protein